MAAGGTGGCRLGKRNPLIRLAFILWYFQKLLALAAPFLFHHFGQAQDDNVQKTTDAERDENDDQIEKPGGGQDGF